MPKISSAVLHSVFYLFRRCPKTGELLGPEGTGAFISRQSRRFPDQPHWYAVTNRHVACTGGASIIGINVSTGGRRYLEFDPSEWHFANDGDDLAAIDLTDHGDLHDLVILTPEDVFITPDIVEEFDIGPGEDTFMCGLFYNHHGGSVNVPALRFGNISMLANVVSTVKVPTGALRPCHLVDTRSRSGFSGSPVFAYRTRGSDLTAIPMGWIRDLSRGGTIDIAHPKNYFVGLLGIHCGQFWETVKAFKSKPEELIGDPVRDGDELDIQGGMTMVVPAWCITDLLNLEVFETMRDERDEKRGAEARSRPQAEGVSKPAPLANDANPTHREDFMRLVGAAARKPEQEG